jgi:uncharacterized protein (TIRG00374 family)
MTFRLFSSVILGTLISAVTLYLAFRNVPFPELVNYLVSIRFVWILPAVALVIIGFALRALRWQYIMGASHQIGFWQAFHPLMIGFAINCVLPGRVGELARPVVLRRQVDVPLTTGLATVVVERVFDLFMLLLLFMWVSAGMQIDPEIEIRFGEYALNRDTLAVIFNGMVTISMLLVVALILLGLHRTRSVLNGLILVLPRLLFFVGAAGKKRIVDRICQPTVRIIENVGTGIMLIKRPKRMSVCLLLSACIWILAAVSYYLFSLGCPDIRLSLIEITAMMVIICFVIALPSVPGFWGLWEAGGVFALMLFGVAEKDAAGFTLANHAVQMFPVILVGMLSAWINGINIMQVSYRNTTHSR